MNETTVVAIPVAWRWLYDMRVFLACMARGAVLRRTIVVLVYAVTALVVLGFLDGWFTLWKELGHASFFAGLAVIVFQLGALYAAALAVQIIHLRLQEVLNYPETAEYVVMPVVSAILRMSGEATFVFCAAISVPAMVVVWLAGVDTWWTQLSLYDLEERGFFAGICVLAALWFLGFCVLLYCYLLAEFISVLFTLANRTSAIHALLVHQTQPTAPEPVQQQPLAP